MRIGFVGLGLMGLPMVRHLVAAGHQLFVASGNARSVEELKALGATVCASPREIAPHVEIFFSCRITPEHSRETFLGADGVIAWGTPGLLCVDLATLDPATSIDIAARLAQGDIGYLDAPISGGPGGGKTTLIDALAMLGHGRSIEASLSSATLPSRADSTR